MKTVVLSAFALLLCISTPSHAAQDVLRLEHAGSADFSAQRAAIERDLADGETYAELSPGTRSEVTSALDSMQQAIEDAGSVQAMGPAQRVELFNAQETVNGLLTQAAEDSRLVCKRERRTGSNYVISACQTVAERRRQREAGAEALRQGTLTPASVLGD